MVMTASGKKVVTTTISPEAFQELKARSIGVGAAAAMWVSKVDEIKEYNEQINKMTENIAKMQDLIRRQSERIHELETGAGGLK